MSDEFVREVQEDIQRERNLRLWQKYGGILVAGVVAIVVGTAAWVGWQQYDLSQKQKLSERYATATALAAQGDIAGAINQFGTLVRDTSGGYRVLAQLRQAALLRDSGDTISALEIYDKLAGDNGAPRSMRDLAIILGALNGLDVRANDEVIERLVPLMGEESPWRFSAREVTALAAIRAGNKERARELLKGLADDLGAPPGIRGRATELLAVTSD
jgi:hypothetical protein